MPRTHCVAYCPLVWVFPTHDRFSLFSFVFAVRAFLGGASLRPLGTMGPRPLVVLTMWVGVYLRCVVMACSRYFFAFAPPCC